MTSIDLPKRLTFDSTNKSITTVFNNGPLHRQKYQESDMPPVVIFQEDPDRYVLPWNEVVNQEKEAFLATDYFHYALCVSEVQINLQYVWTYYWYEWRQGNEANYIQTEDQLPHPSACHVKRRKVLGLNDAIALVLPWIKRIDPD